MNQDELTVRPLDADSWPAYADLIERHNGVWGGCWCMGFHSDRPEHWDSVEQKKSDKCERVCSGRAHAAVVFHGDRAVGWCQYGPAGELDPGLKFKRKYWPGVEVEPDWRITCFFVDRKYRGKGVAAMALDGALNAIAKAGGGLVEAYPEDVEGRKIAGVFIYLGTATMFERRGFERVRQVAKHHWVMTKAVAAEI